MDYKEKYEMALEIAQEMLATIKMLRLQLHPQDPFLELTESEDESIRKAMINYFTNGKEYLSLTPYSKEDYIAWLEKQSEQKPADKVEPKFKVGDWIVNNTNKATFLISSVNNGYCTLKDTEGKSYSPCLPPTEDDYHLWTIQDAKDGDVLTNKYGDVMLFKGITDDRHICGYCQYSAENRKLYNECSDFPNYYPSTKEQRDTLMKAMADAGYTFDFEKKELKKIEEEFNGEDYGIDSLWHAQNILERTLGCVEGYQSDDGILEHKCAITAVKKLYGQKSAWSEEDESHIRYLIECLEHCKKGVSLTMTTSTAQEYIDWLKSLRTQSHYKPSNEQLDSLYDVLNPCDGFNREVLESLYEDLKKLREK